MKRLKNEPLKKHTTFKIGGPVEILSIPQSEGELIDEIKRCNKNDITYRILGRGSNVLTDDRGIKGVVIKNTESCLELEKRNDFVEVGSSISLQKFVKYCVDNDLEGMEYLYSIPATIGGAIYMNAGRGKRYNKSISNNLVAVKIYDEKEDKVKWLKKEECKFQYRSSIFHKHKDWIILKGKFELDYQPKKIGEKKIKERMKIVKKSQDRQYPNAGSIFKRKSVIGSKLINGLRIGNAKLKDNWILNLGNASFEDVMWLIKISKVVGYITFKKPELEIDIWKD